MKFLNSALARLIIAAIIIVVFFFFLTPGAIASESPSRYFFGGFIGFALVALFLGSFLISEESRYSEKTLSNLKYAAILFAALAFMTLMAAIVSFDN